MRIGLALSGGGFRATVFHLGVLARLAEEDRIEDVTFLSTVSGGSMCAGLVYAKSGFRWPSSERFLGEVVPQARELLTTQDLQLGMIRRVLRSVLTAPWSIFETRADDFSALLRERWGVRAQLREVSDGPRWMINATCHETGRNWRFEHFWMGDYLLGYTRDTDIPLSDALAASAALPGLVGPLVLDTRGRSWFRYPEALTAVEEPVELGSDTQRGTEPTTPAYPQVHLWDGGIYDNLGVEGLHNFDTGWREGIDFLIVSDASGKGQPGPYRPGPRALVQIITGVLTDQIRALRTRSIVERMKSPDRDPGAFVRIGNTCKQVLAGAGRHDEVAKLCEGCLPEEQVRLAASMGTTARRLSRDEFERLFRHGFEVADYTLCAYHPHEFEHVGYDRSGWG
jgi:NTE family protein